MASLKGTKTEQNLLKAFAGESQARMRYDYFAKVAKQEGLEQISAIFSETSLNEKEHAKRFFKFLEGGMVEITASYPAGVIGDTMANLKASADGEHEEWTSMYPEFAKVAREEGFTRIANLFEMVAKIEQEHDARYNLLLANIQEDKVFKRNEKMIWMCSNCGHVYEGTEAPEICPVCAHPKAFFEIKDAALT